MSRLHIGMTDLPDNRAVSALFRVFGGVGDYVVADGRACAKAPGMHLGEYQAFSVLIPLTLFVGICLRTT